MAKRPNEETEMKMSITIYLMHVRSAGGLKVSEGSETPGPHPVVRRRSSCWRHRTIVVHLLQRPIVEPRFVRGERSVHEAFHVSRGERRSEHPVWSRRERREAVTTATTARGRRGRGRRAWRRRRQSLPFNRQCNRNRNLEFFSPEFFFRFSDDESCEFFHT